MDEIPASKQLVIFSGTAGGVSDTFHASIHRFQVDGVGHFANVVDPQIPSSLAAIVGGVVSLHDFRRAPATAARRALGSSPQWNLNGAHYLFPADFATIYNLNPLYSAGTTGAGVAIAIAGRSNIRPSDVAAFRSSAALEARSPAVILDGTDPGLVTVDQDEATLDVEWAGAAAPAANVKLVASASTAATDGIDLSAQYIVNHALAPVLSVSYGSCEQQMGASELAFYSNLWQQAAAEGITVLVASGDSGAAGCNSGSDATASEAGVNGLCSSPYSTCVGGTQFNEGSNPGQFWADVNKSNRSSAMGYIPEVVWNESGANGGAWLWASGGGASRVYEQPAWQQNVVGSSAANGMRGVPDVSLAAAMHDGYIVFENGVNWVVSGTSAGAPSMAGVIALVVQANGGGAQGNANPTLYRLANASPSAFHSTESGTNSVPGVAGFYATGNAYNLATGLGSVDAAVLVGSWESSAAPPTLTLDAVPGPITLPQGGSISVRLVVTAGGSFAGTVTLSLSGLPAGVSAVWSSNPVSPQAGIGSVALTLAAAPFASTLPGQVTIIASGNGLESTRGLTVLVQPSRFPIRYPRLPVVGRCNLRWGQFSSSNACLARAETAP